MFATDRFGTTFNSAPQRSLGDGQRVPLFIGNLPPGPYTVGFRDPSGRCNITAGQFVIEGCPPGAATPTANAVCEGGTLQLGVDAGVSYNWAGPNGFTSNVQNPAISNANSLNSGQYFVTVTQANGCSNTGSVTTRVFSRPGLSATAIQPRCVGDNNGEYDIQITGGRGPFSFSDDRGNSGNNLSNFIQVTGLSSGVYNVTVTDFNGCASDVSVELFDPPSG